MPEVYSEFTLGDLLLTYRTDRQGRLSMTLIPAAMAGKRLDKDHTPEPLV